MSVRPAPQVRALAASAVGSLAARLQPEALAAAVAAVAALVGGSEGRLKEASAHLQPANRAFQTLNPRPQILKTVLYIRPATEERRAEFHATP